MAQPLFEVTIPIRTVSESNLSEHWAKKGKRHKQQKTVTRLWMNQALSDQTSLNNLEYMQEHPLILVITRLAPRSLDGHDNLAMSLKWVTDAICECFVPGLAIGRADSSDRFKEIRYEQKKGVPKTYAVSVQVFPASQ